METIKSYRIKRRLKFGESFREPGELAPEMHLYRRVDSLVHSNQLSHEDMLLDEFRTGVETYCPELKDQLYTQLGVKDEPKPAKKVAEKKAAPAPKIEKLKD